MTTPVRSRASRSSGYMRGDVGWWRPAGGCDHDECGFAELDVEAWLAELDDPITRILASYDESDASVGGVPDDPLAAAPTLDV